jgi:hypothetical protein
MPSPTFGSQLERWLLEYDATAISIQSFERQWPVSQVNQRYSMTVHDTITERLGSLQPRAIGSFRTFIRHRRKLFKAGGVFRKVMVHEQFIFDDSMRNMASHLEEFADLTDDVNDQAIDDQIQGVTERDIGIGIIKAAEANLPRHIRNYLSRFDGILLINHDFVMHKLRNELARQFCVRTERPSPCNAHADFICRLFEELRRQLPDGHLKNKDAMVAALNEYRVD